MYVNNIMIIAKNEKELDTQQDYAARMLEENLT